MAATCDKSPETEHTSALQLQVHALKDHFGSKCKLIKNVGDFIYIAKVEVENLDLSINFQIDDKYPATPANTVIKSRMLDLEKQTQLSEILTNLQPISLLQTVNAATEWMKENTDSKKCHSPDIEKTSKKSVTQKKPKVQQEKIVSKAPSMKTADDVIHRILWDESFPNECFCIGYIDRFLGVVEKPFNVFSWEDLASVDYDVLAIPKHRIQYFKYKTRVIWDKIHRIDDIFGSTGSETTIEQVMSTVDDEEAKLDHDNAYEDSDSEDDIIIDTGFERQAAPDDHLYPREKYWGARIRPTHFLALRVTNPQIIAKIKEIQEEILELEPSYSQCLIPVERLHMTLCCVGLDSSDQVQKAAEILQKAKSELANLTEPPIKVHFRSVNHFSNNTLYACTDHSDRLLTFVEHLKLCLTEAGVSIRDIFDFVPHMTILKLSMLFGREMNTRYLDPRLMHLMEDTEIGFQTLDNVHLCAMSDDRQSDGFYECPSVITL